MPALFFFHCDYIILAGVAPIIFIRALHSRRGHQTIEGAAGIRRLVVGNNPRFCSILRHSFKLTSESKQGRDRYVYFRK